ncbi:TetR/AcrR family transcriptional regulator [Uliginosibacterium paludis]|uniref:TetR/AcrR family transcriptional regulator n=1 Tax=Uliginosibacterium paludis TaxID=1615952 RepID=A0ABV2CN52_9RHOO
MNSERPDTRQHILDCGQRLVATKGFVGVGLAELLTTAGVPKGSFYHYFASKEVFGIALLDHYFDDYLNRLDALAQASGLTGAQRLETYCERWTETQRGEDAALYCLIVKLSAEIADLSDAMRERMLAGTGRVLGVLADWVAEGQRDSSIGNRQSATALAETFYELWLGASLLAKLRRDSTAFEGALARTRELLQSG